jgi:hypothetical protein
MRSPGLFFLAILLTSVACKPKEYICKSRQECVASNGGYGLCVDTHCAFVDQTCPSGWRFDDTAGAEAKLCVSGTLLTPDGGVSADAGPTADGPLPSPDAGRADARLSDAGGKD